MALNNCYEICLSDKRIHVKIYIHVYMFLRTEVITVCLPFSTLQTTIIISFDDCHLLVSLRELDDQIKSPASTSCTILLRDRQHVCCFVQLFVKPKLNSCSFLTSVVHVVFYFTQLFMRLNRSN